MHRTQVIIDDKHYAFLKKKAEQEKKSISQVLREIIESYSRKSDVYSLLSVSGIQRIQNVTAKTMINGFTVKNERACIS